jgi:hypothetical protein
MREAGRALRAAQKKAGTSEAILFRLNELAHLGLDTLAAQAQLASAQAVVDRTEAVAQPAQDERPIKTEAAAQGPRPKARPTAQVPASGPAQGWVKRKEEAKPPFENWAEEAWATRPTGPQGWAERVAELASVFPKDRELPGRAPIIEAMKLRALDPELPALRFAWTNKGYVSWAMSDLKALRAAGYPDPVFDPAKVRTEA